MRDLFQTDSVDSIFEHTAEVLDTHDPKGCLSKKSIGMRCPATLDVYWPEFVFGLTALGAATSFAIRHSPLCGGNDLQKWIGIFSASVNEFVEKHVVNPVNALIDEVIFDTFIDVADIKAVEDASVSLACSSTTLTITTLMLCRRRNLRKLLKSAICA